jgi:hypothetical protein
MSKLTDYPDYLFSLRVPVSVQRPLPPLGSFVVCTPRYQTRMVVIHAFDANHTGPHGHSRIDIVVRFMGKVVFKRDDTWCGVPSGTCLDGIQAKELVLSTVAMKPGDTDEEYFSGYSAEQYAFANAWGETLDMIKQDRYCDHETGECKSPRRR